MEVTPAWHGRLARELRWARDRGLVLEPVDVNGKLWLAHVEPFEALHRVWATAATPDDALGETELWHWTGAKPTEQSVSDAILGAWERLYGSR